METKWDPRYSVLESRFAMSTLFTIADNPGSSKSDMMRRSGFNERTVFVRINELIDAGLVQEDNGPRSHNVKKLYLTAVGQEVVSHLKRVRDAMERAI